MTILEVAIKLAKNGIYTYPVDAITKTPRTPHAFKDATVDTETLKQYFYDNTTGIAINLELSNLVCLDIDNGHEGTGDHKGTLEITQLNSDFSFDESNYVEETRNGGYHLLFKRPFKDVHKVKISSHVELLTDSTIIAPTKGYKCAYGNLLDEQAELPSWIKHLCGNDTGFKAPNKRVFYPKRKYSIGRALDGIYEPVPIGSRHDFLVDTVVALFGTGAELVTIYNLTHTIGDAMNLPKDEIEQIYTWAYRKAVAQMKSEQKGA